MILQKAITFIVLLMFVYGILEFDTKHALSISNIPSYIGFIVFIAYFIYSLRKASKKEKKEDKFY